MIEFWEMFRLLISRFWRALNDVAIYCFAFQFFCSSFSFFSFLLLYFHWKWFFFLAVEHSMITSLKLFDELNSAFLFFFLSFKLKIASRHLRKNIKQRTRRKRRRKYHQLMRNKFLFHSKIISKKSWKTKQIENELWQNLRSYFIFSQFQFVAQW